jgi:lysozyme family protein
MNREQQKRDIINAIIEIEGVYSDDPNDSGGQTSYGTTEAEARASGYTGDMRDWTREMSYNLFSTKYWDSVKADGMPIELAEEAVDTAINMGPGRAASFLQDSLNAFNKQGKLYPDLIVDNSIGGKTISALNAYLKTRDLIVLLKAVNCLQGAYYLGLSKRYPKNEEFVYGWIKNRVSL